MPKNNLDESDENFVPDEPMPDDNIDLASLTEDAITLNTLSRYKHGRFYTMTGAIVTSLNPCKPVPNLYGKDAMSAMLNPEMELRSAHLFRASQGAYRRFSEQRVSQSIVITGVSGAGKTEACKYMMEHLCWLAEAEQDSVAPGRPISPDDKATVAVFRPDDAYHTPTPPTPKRLARQACRPTGGDQPASVVARDLIDSVPIFEAFGNAATTRNHNSSRFGKYTMLFFEGARGISSARCVTAMLERSRLVYQAAGESNFHIFYQLLAGVRNGHPTSCGLLRDAHPHDFRYLRAYAGDWDEDVALRSFEATSKAFDTLDYDDSKLQRTTLFNLLVGILHLGNIAFEDDGANGSSVSHSSSKAYERARDSLGIVDLATALTRVRVQAGGARSSSCEVPRTPLEARDSCDALAKRVYTALFAHVVDNLNALTGAPALPKPFAKQLHTPWIGLLDIFGFEIFHTNSLEQLLINYANEVMQMHFLTHVFYREQELYNEEGIRYDDVDVFNNFAILTAVQGAPHGIVPLLDEQCRLGERASDRAFCERLNTKNAACVAEAEKLDQRSLAAYDPRCTFTLAHFVAPVTYHAKDFVQKNRDTLFHDVAAVLSKSTVPLLAELFPTSSLPTEEELKRSGSGRSYNTVVRTFSIELKELTLLIEEGGAHFVRCIKPNESLTPEAADAEMVRSQLRSCGLFDAARMVRSMWPSRVSYNEVDARYLKLLCHLRGPAKSLGGPAIPLGDLHQREFTSALCCALDVDPASYQIGATKIFFEGGGGAAALNSLLRVSPTSPVCAQVVLRWKLVMWSREWHVAHKLLHWLWRARQRLKGRGEHPLRKGVLDVEARHVHGYRRLRRAHALEELRQRQATRLQKIVRGMPHRRAWRTKRAAATVLGRTIRAAVAMVLKQRYDAAATHLQASTRMYLARRQLLAWRAAPLLALLRLQALTRGKLMSRRYAALRSAALQMQSSWRMVRIRLMRKDVVHAAAFLKRGVTMVKFSASKSRARRLVGVKPAPPHPCHVWLSDDEACLCWSAPLTEGGGETPPSPPRPDPKRSLPLSSISALALGMAQTNAMHNAERRDFKVLQARPLSDELKRSETMLAGPQRSRNLDRLVSILTPQRTLDLMATSKVERLEWARALQVLLVHSHTVDTANELSVRARTFGPKPVDRIFSIVAKRMQEEELELTRCNRAATGPSRKEPLVAERDPTIAASPPREHTHLPHGFPVTDHSPRHGHGDNSESTSFCSDLLNSDLEENDTSATASIGDGASAGDETAQAIYEVEQLCAFEKCDSGGVGGGNGGPMASPRQVPELTPSNELTPNIYDEPAQAIKQAKHSPGGTVLAKPMTGPVLSASAAKAAAASHRSRYPNLKPRSAAPSPMTPPTSAAC